VDSLGSPVINVARLPISWTSSTAQRFQVPPVSMATVYFTTVYHKKLSNKTCTMVKLHKKGL